MMPHDVIGMAGVALILLAYGLLQFERVSHDDYAFLLLNTAGALLVLLSLLSAFNLAAFVLEAVWLGISGYGIARRLLRGRFARMQE